MGERQTRNTQEYRQTIKDATAAAAVRAPARRAGNFVRR